MADGIALVSGLPEVRLDELVRFERGQVGYAVTLDRDLLGCVLLDDAQDLEAGHWVRGTGEVVRVPVGPALLGRTIDPLGRPLDDERQSSQADTSRLKGRRRRSLIAILSANPCRPEFSYSIPCSRSAAASAS